MWSSFILITTVVCLHQYPTPQKATISLRWGVTEQVTQQVKVTYHTVVMWLIFLFNTSDLSQFQHSSGLTAFAITHKFSTQPET